MKHPKVQFYCDTAGEFRWRLRAGNGAIIADSSEGYRSLSNARRAWDTVRLTIRNKAVLPEVL